MTSSPSGNQIEPVAVASDSSVAVGSINVSGNVEGNIVVGNHNFVVNTNHGTIVYQEAAPAVKRRDVSPRAPRAVRGFLGRNKELAELSGWIEASEAVMLYGPEGIGKSSLLRQAAHSEAAQSMQDGVVFIEGVDENGIAFGLDDIVQNLFDALYESNPPLKVTATTARSYLSNTSPLVLLDQIAVPPSALTSILDSIPSGSLLFTSRQMPAGDTFLVLRLKSLTNEEAASLLASKAGITLDEASQKQLETIADLLSNIPLALTVTANVMREKEISLQQTVDELASITPPSQDPVQSAIERAYGFAFSNLSVQEIEMLSLVAAAPGISVDRAWLERISGGKATSEKLEALELLRANSPRLRLPEGFKPLVAQSSELKPAREKLLSSLRGKLRYRSKDLDFLSSELGNLIGLMHWAAEEGRWAQVIALGRALDPILTLRGWWDTWKSVLDEVLNAARHSNNLEAEAWALHQIGTREIGTGSHELAIDYLEQALQMRREMGETESAAYTRHNLDYLRRYLAGILPPKSNGGRSLRWGLAGLIALLLSLCTAVVITAMIWKQPPSPKPIEPTPTNQVGPVVTTTEDTQYITPTPEDFISGTPGIPGGGSDWWLTFYSDRSGSVELYQLNVAEAIEGLFPGAIQITEIGPGYKHPVLSPVEDLVAAIGDVSTSMEGAVALISTGSFNFTSQTTMADNEIYVLSSDGSNPVNISNNHYRDSSPTWSPDGQWLAYVSSFDDPVSGERVNQIYIAREDGSEQTLLTPEGADYGPPAWSPDSSRIAYTLGKQLFVVDIHTLDINNTLPPNARDPAWCENQVTYIAEDQGVNHIRSVVPENNLVSRNLLEGWRGLLFFPSWSSDCAQLAYVGLDTSAEISLNLLPAEKRLRVGKGTKNCIAAPRWHPNGGYIVYQDTNLERGDLDIYLMDLETLDTINLTDHPANDFFLFGACERIEFYYP